MLGRGSLNRRGTACHVVGTGGRCAVPTGAGGSSVSPPGRTIDGPSPPGDSSITVITHPYVKSGPQQQRDLVSNNV